MRPNHTARLLAAAAFALAFSPFASAGQIFGWELDLSGLGGGDNTGINNLSFNGESYITNDASRPLANFTDQGVFNILQYNAGVSLDLGGGGQLTAVYSGATGTTDFTNNTFTFDAGGTLQFYFNPTPISGTDQYGTTANNVYGAASGTLIGTFTQIAGGGGTIEASGAPTDNGQITATFQADSLASGVWQYLGTDLMPTLTIGFVTTNASTDGGIGSNTDLQQALTKLLSGTASTPGNDIPNDIFVTNGGQFKLETVPEPATIALMGLGLAGIGFGSKRRRAA
jgi:hypothetical protein